MIEAIEASTVLTLLVLVFASYRATRLIVFDEILGSYPEQYVDPETAEVRTVPGDRGTGLRRLLDIWLYDDEGEARGPARRWLGKLYTCPYCMGVWVSTGVVLVWFHAGPALAWAVVVAAIAGGAALLSGRDGS